MIKSFFASLATYKSHDVLIILFLGFFSGLPLALTASTLTVWLTESGISKASIGLFAIIGMPYTLKFLWSPLIDQAKLPVLTDIFGRRRSWIILTQIFLIITLVGLGFSHPGYNPWNTALWALLVAIGSASQDIVIDAYRVEKLSKEELGPGAGAIQFGYRIGMLASGAGALFLAEFVGWESTYLFMATLMVLGIFTVLFAKEPKANSELKNKKIKSIDSVFKEAVIAPFSDFMKHEGWLVILLFVMVFKLADALAGMMTNPFLIDVGFSKSEIATIVKTYGLFATLLGVFIGGAMVRHYGMMKSLFIGGVLQIVSVLVFSVQAIVGHDLWVLAVTISFENLASGMGSAAFVAYLSSLCSIKYTATQYALLSSIAVIGRIWLSSLSGFIVEFSGWFYFFIISGIAGIPGLIMIGIIVGYSNKKTKKKKS